MDFIAVRSSSRGSQSTRLGAALARGFWPWVGREKATMAALMVALTLLISIFGSIVCCSAHGEEVLWLAARKSKFRPN
jgi:hypothetical protein